MIENEFQPGPAVMAEAAARGITAESLVEHMLYEVTPITVETKLGSQRVNAIPGHGVVQPYGPPRDYRATVMVVGKMPGRIEDLKLELLSGPSGALLESMLPEIGLNYDDWFITNVVKFRPPNNVKKLSAKWIKDGRYQLEEELRLVNPKFLLLMGSEAVKAFFGTKATLSKYRGATTLEYKGIPVVVSNQPAAILKEPKLTNDLRQDLQLLQSKIADTHRGVLPTTYEVVRDEVRLTAIVDQLLAEGATRFAVDCEWGGINGSDFEKGGLLRMIQFSHRAQHAFGVEIRGKDFATEFDPNPEAAFAQLRRLFSRKGVRLGGHNIPADIRWLTGEAHIECIPQFFDGLDSMQAYHLLYPNETSYKLEFLATRFTDLGRYDLVVEDWLVANVKKESRTVYLNMFGYAQVPDDVLYPYAMKDVDVVMRVWDLLEERLAAVAVETPYEMPGVHHGKTVRTLLDFYHYIEHPAIFPRYEMQCEGLPADRKRLTHLVELFERRGNELAEQLQKLLKWPTYNPRSYPQAVEMLFGQLPNQKRIRPENGISLGLTPIKTTEKPPKDWARVKPEQRNTGKVQPATDVESLQILQAQMKDVNPEYYAILETALKFKYVDQVHKNFLRPAELNPFTGQYNWIHGLMSCIDGDERIRTTLLALTDTGRYSSLDPNMQNLPKKREADLRRAFSPDEERLKATEGWDGMTVQALKDLQLLSPEYFTIRSCFRAPPGYVIMEADYKQAELKTLAYIAHDENMMAVMNDPTRDMHSEMAVDAFGLYCHYSQVKAMYPSLRVGAKAANFRIPYGGGPAALSRQVKAEAGVDLSERDSAKIINTFKVVKYPLTQLFFEACHRSMEDHGQVTNAFGRRRLFSPTDDRGILAANRREAGNMPIQGTVADALNIALFNLWRFRDSCGMKFRMALAVHDAVFLLVPWYEVEYVKNEVLPVCMSHGAYVPTIDLTLEVDITIMRRWGVAIAEEEAIAEARAEAEAEAEVGAEARVEVV